MPNRSQDEDRLPFSLERGVRLLRESPAVRDEWRDALLARTARENSRVFAARRTRVPLSWAIAAGLVCALAGGAVTSLVQSHRMELAVIGPTPAVLPVRFTVVAPGATTVSIVGDFNHWQPAALPLRRSADGRIWEVEIRLPLGRYSYAFLIDGKLAPDPTAPRAGDDDFGAPNSVIMVRGS
jgi:hypothetical protein